MARHQSETKNLAYEAYAEYLAALGRRDLNGNPLPWWEELTPAEQEAWYRAVGHVMVRTQKMFGSGG